MIPATQRGTVVAGLCVDFGSREQPTRIVRDATFTIAPGTTLGLVGESGSGKSTIGAALIGLLAPGLRMTGSVALDGTELIGRDETELAAIRGTEVATVFQNPFRALNPSIRVGAQIAEAMVVHGLATKDEARERAIELLAETGLPKPATAARAYPHELSGGMLQRAVIALAVSCEPALLVADEPTTALDARVQARILDLLDRLVAEREMAMLLISHDLGVVAKLAQQVAVIYSGTIVEYGPTESLLTAPRHPYTQALLAAWPRVDADRSRRLRTIDGPAAPATSKLAGCRFASRCPFALERCRKETPVLEPPEGHSAACWVANAPQGAL